MRLFSRRTSEWQIDAPPPRAWLSAFVLYVAATAVMLRQQLQAYTQVPDLGDPLFSMWRLGWVAHQLPAAPRHLFDANIFHPATGTLAYSDAMLLPGFLSAPVLWLGAPLTVVYTSLMLLSFVTAGLAMFVLAYGVTHHVAAASIAGLVFAFDPFRFSHYSHLELQLTFGMPLALFFLLRTLTTGRRRDGILAGVCVATQGLCSLYYGAYLSASLMAVVVLWFGVVARPPRGTLLSLGIAAAIAIASSVPVVRAYSSNRAAVGDRQQSEILAFSATPHDYLAADRQSAVYRSLLWDPNNGERKLFTGTLPVLLGIAALVPPIEPILVPTVGALAFSVDASFGLHGTIYSWLYKLPGAQAFRAPARFRAVAGLYLALMAALAVAGAARRMKNAVVFHAAVTALALLLLVDLHPSLELQPVWDHAPGIYRYIPDRRAVVADLPLPTGADPFWHDPVYMYFSTFHWHPIVNGASGFKPRWYDALGEISRDFPSDETLDAYRRLETEYFVVHEGYYHPTRFKRVVSAIESQPRLQFVASDTWEEGECRLYRLLR